MWISYNKLSNVLMECIAIVWGTRVELLRAPYAAEKSSYIFRKFFVDRDIKLCKVIGREDNISSSLCQQKWFYLFFQK